jgi:hypothetical protein
MKHRQQRHAGDRERHDRWRVVVTHGVHVRPRLENLAMDHTLRIGPFLRRHDRVRVEIVFEDVGGLHQRRGARAREEVALRVSRMAHADVAEGIQEAFVGDDPVGGRKVAAQVCESVRHGHFPRLRRRLHAPSVHGSKAEAPAIFKKTIC